MLCGKFLSLEEARQSDAFKQFAKEHPSEADRELFLKHLLGMLPQVPTGTRTRRAT